MPSVQDRWQRWILPASILILSVPFAVAVLALRQPQWHPVLDLAMTELRVRDVFTSHTPLIGLPGRIGDFPDQGSHPGPLSFYALAPFYRLFGSTSWALQVATAAVNLIAGALALWIALRRGRAVGEEPASRESQPSGLSTTAGRRGAVMVAAVFLLLAVLVRGYGIDTFVEPWNPLMPLLWWVVLLLAIWSVLCRDLAMLPVAVVAASFCAQTHVPYLGLVLGLGLVAVVGIVWIFVRARTDAERRRGVIRWVAIAVLVGAVIWLPPMIDQFTGDTRNISMLARHFTTDPPEERIGVRAGGEWLVANLNPRHFAVGDEGLSVGPLVGGGPLVGAAQNPDSSLVPGSVLLGSWTVAVAVAVRRRHAALGRLHVVIGSALVLGVLSLAGVFGKQWYYLSLWTWAIAALMIGSILWTFLAWARDRLPVRERARAGSVVGVAMLLVAMLVVTSVTVGAVDQDPPDAMLSEVLGEVVGPTAEALESGVGAAEGRDGRYLVTWSDTYFIGSQGYGLALELERLGFDVGVTKPFRVPVTPQRVLATEDATAEIHFSTGSLLDEVAARPGAVEIIRVDPRSAEEVEEFDDLREEIIAELRDLGLDDLVPLVDGNLFALTIEPGLPPDLEHKAFRLLMLGQPTAVFILPVPR